MGEERELNETRSSGDSRYLYGKIIQVTCPSRYGGDLVKTGLVIARFYSTTEPLFTSVSPLPSNRLLPLCKILKRHPTLGLQYGSETSSLKATSHP